MLQNILHQYLYLFLIFLFIMTNIHFTPMMSLVPRIKTPNCYKIFILHFFKFRKLIYLTTIMSDITIISLNVKGLQSDQKRRDMFNYLRNKTSSIIFLQETHSSEKDEKRWTAEWGHKCFFSHGNTNSAGVMILFQNNFEYSVKTSTIGISYKSDHSIISLQISFTNLKRGPGYWKFNANLLYDDNYTKLVRTVIKQTIDEYYIAGDNNENIVYSINDQLLFEIIKMRIRSKSIKYSANRKNEMLKHEKNIEKQILKLESRSHSLTSDEAKTLHERKLELETLRNQKIKGIIFRSRAKWYEEGEKNTEYFLNLEKRNYINKHMSEIFDNNNVLQTDNSKFLKINAAFFKKLYSNNYNKESKEVINNFLDTEVKLSEPDKEGCEGPISLDECITNDEKRKKSWIRRFYNRIL